MRSAPRRWVLLAGLVAVALLAVACGGDADDDDIDRSTTPSTTATTDLPGGPTPTPTSISEFKVAFINLYSPLTLGNNEIAAETLTPRIQQLAAEIKRLDPDLIAFNEASVTGAGNAIELLVAELKLDWAYMRANPGFGLENADAEPVVKASGFEEGELLFSKYAILEYERIPLNPRSSELGEGRIALYARIKAPAPLGEINVFVTHLTGGGEVIRQAQAGDLVKRIDERRGDRPTLLIGDMGDPVESATYDLFRAAGYSDPAWGGSLATCCRETVVGTQPDLTVRPDCIMSLRFPTGSVQLFAQHPVTLPDGSQLYASDHNGLFAVFPVGGG
ncbi:MAG: endonuclease/exonuclease/phosphatase family protein [Dehalococcoidia bacterium]